MITAIVNPKSANGKTAKDWPDIKAKLESTLGKIDVSLTQSHCHAIELTRKALKSGTKIILSVGGDGTTNEVVNGFFENNTPINPNARLAVISRGTGGDFVKSFSFPKDVDQIGKIIKNTEAKPCDLVLAKFQTRDGQKAQRYFINAADLGVGSLTAHKVNKTTKILGGTVSFFWGAVKAILSYRNKIMTLELDGKIIAENEKHLMVAIGNGEFFGGGMHIAPKAELSDGLLEVVLVGDCNFGEILTQLAPKIYSGKCEDFEKVKRFKGKHLKISSPEEVFLETDGEVVGKANAEFTILPSAIRLFGI